MDWEMAFCIASAHLRAGTSILYQYLSLKTGRSVGNYQFIFNGAIIRRRRDFLRRRNRRSIRLIVAIDYRAGHR
ncbi:MAG: hypothetical protein MZU97_22665 [Bacillus subtilis]|nr:hypothetical protein [Bacillus subtilis]